MNEEQERDERYTLEEAPGLNVGYEGAGIDRAILQSLLNNGYLIIRVHKHPHPEGPTVRRWDITPLGLDRKKELRAKYP